jgi:hypothetical protein
MSFLGFMHEKLSNFLIVATIMTPPLYGGGVVINIEKCLTFRDLSSIIPTTISE